MMKELFADAEKISFGGDTANIVEKGPGGFHSQSDEVHVLLHLVDLGIFAGAERLRGVVKQPQVTEAHHGRSERRAPRPVAAGGSDGTTTDCESRATDHQASGTGLLQNFLRLVCRIDIAVGQNRAGHGFHRAPDEVVVNLAPIASLTVRP